MATQKGVAVSLYIYDLSRGLATMLAPMILGAGCTADGVWHTSVVAYEREYFYGSGGVICCAPGSTQLGAPQRVQRAGETFVPFAVFADYLDGLAASTFTGDRYHLFEHNCNHFSDEVLGFLCGDGERVPKYILEQPQTLPPPLRAALTSLLASMQPQTDRNDRQELSRGVRHLRPDSPDYHTLNTQIEEARVRSAALEARRSTLADKLARKERRNMKKRRKQIANGGGTMHDEEHHDVRLARRQVLAALCARLWPRTVQALASLAATTPDMSEAVETAPRGEALAGGGGGAGTSAQPLDELEARRQDELRRRALDPPILYPDIDGAAEFEKLEEALSGTALDEAERQSLDELRQYLVGGEGSWVLGDEFLTFIGRILCAPAMPGAARVCAVRCLAGCALREDVSLVLHQDRRTHALLNYGARIERLPLDEQEALTLFLCNLFSHVSSSEWLLYISEWECDGQPLSNIRVTTKVCVHALLGESERLRDVGSALMYNVATKERLGAGRALRALLPPRAKCKVFDEVCVELGMALLQLLSLAPQEEIMFRSLKALARLARHSQEVPQLVAVVGPDPTAFRGTSPRIDEQIDLIMQKVK